MSADPAPSVFRRNWRTHSAWLRHMASRLKRAKTMKEVRRIAALLDGRADSIQPKKSGANDRQAKI